MVEFLQGWFPSINKERFPDGVHKMRIIDRKSDRYQERVVNEATGEVVVDKDEKLSKHK